MRSIRSKSKFSLLLAVLALCALCFGIAGCGSSSGGSPQIDKPSGNPATDGSLVYMDDSGVVFWGQDQFLCTALVEDDGQIDDFVIEGALSSNIKSLAVYGDYLYVAQEDGFFRYPLSMFSSKGEDGSSSEMLSEEMLQQGFAIQDDYIYYNYGHTLCRMPVDGGNKTELNTGVVDFAIIGDVIYFTTEDGALCQTPIGGSSTKLATLDADDAYLTVSDDWIFCKSGSGSPICMYDFDSGSLETIDPMIEPAEGSYLFAYGDALLYYDDGSVACVYDANSGEVSDTRGDHYFVLSGIYSTLVDGKYYSFNPYGTKLSCYDFDSNTCFSYDTSEEMADMLDSIRRSQGGDSNPAPSSDYGVYDDWSGACGDGWSGEFPEAWRGYVGAEVLDQGRIVTFFESQASANGFGGVLVTLVRTADSAPAYAHYETLYSYSDGTLLYAIYPTDVEYDPDNPGQYPACYNVVDGFLDSLVFD